MSCDLEIIEQTLEPYYRDRHASAAIAQHIAALEPGWRNFVLEWVVSLAKIEPDIAHRFASGSGAALRILGREKCESWLQRTLQVFDEQGLQAAMQCLENPDRYIVSQRKRSRGLTLGEARGVLEHFLQLV